MATVNQRMSVEEIEQIVAQRVANAIEAIAIYESINQNQNNDGKQSKVCKLQVEGVNRRDCRISAPKTVNTKASMAKNEKLMSPVMWVER
ncbi:hypothetical protein Tco_0586101 [Tanacetum coccineum]